jgi:endoglucanase
MIGTIRRSRRRIALVLSAIVAAVAGLGILVPTIAQAAAGCRVDYTVQNQWPGGFTANVEITNLGDRIEGWQLRWTFPSNQQVTQAWNATVTASGSQVTAANVGYNGTIQTNAKVSFGFNGSFSGTNTNPTSFTLNGVECSGAVTPTTSATPSTSPTTGGPGGPGGDAVAVVAAMEPGWNLGNSLDAVGDDETAWGNPRITRDLIRNIRAQGYNSIRIPVTWDRHIGSAPNYTISAAYLNRVQEVVDWALAEDLYVLINIHHDSWIWMADMPSNRTNVLNRYNAIWTQVAAKFRNHSPKLTFESVNEPQFNNVNDATSFQLLDELNREFHRIVRASGGNNADRLLVLPTLHTNSEQARLDPLVTTINALNDPNLAATVHYYGFWPFSVNVAGFTRFNDEVRQDVVAHFDRVHNTFVQRGIPVIIGEYGLLGFDQHTGTVQQGEKLKFFEFVGHYAKQKQLTLQIWDNGQHFNRNTFQWRDAEFFGMMQASWAGRSGTASADHVYIERAASITDKTLTLNLNGRTFQRLRLGNTTLTQGTDYTLSGSTLTIRSARLSQIAGSSGYGVRGNLFADFSGGVPWRISVIAYDRPILSNASGSTGSFAIPTQFRGDQLATMEAKYADGSNAGPHDWTSYKEFSRAFEPDTGAGTIRITQDFFNGVDNRPVTLTFHFWSGATVTYTVTKSGSNVTGTAS